MQAMGVPLTSLSHGAGCGCKIGAANRLHATVQQLQKDYGNKLRVVMKQNPLSFHANAKPAALAAMAAGEQGKYWEMHDRLFQNSRTLAPAQLAHHASTVRVDDRATAGRSIPRSAPEPIQRVRAFRVRVAALGPREWGSACRCLAL